MQTVAETPTFSRQADKLFSDKERRELIEYLRVIYFYGGEGVPLYALLAYAKSDKTDLSPRERRAAAALVRTIKSQGRETR
ncbi:hypothetical protein [Candidatus Palauibacter sp.]|uniref:hypothetical protein n=1 Tax=Candidatus Palauibacter sp. TaxID=3101350 RepID=UPI003B01E2FC